VLQAFLNDDSGATAIEYGLVAGLVSVAILVSLSGLGTTISDGYAQINDSMAVAAGSPPAVVPGDVVQLEPVLDQPVIAIK
jgi:pilus assembly protein Flp/PilA